VENPLDVTILLWVQGWEKKKKKKKREKKRAKVALSIAPPPKNFKPRGWKPITPETFKSLRQDPHHETFKSLGLEEKIYFPKRKKKRAKAKRRRNQ